MSLIKLLKKKTKNCLFTTPSHAGKKFIYHKFYQWYKSDISEVDTFNPEKALKTAEEFATKIYKTKYTKFLTNGSSSGVISAILASSRNKKILIWDNAHPCHKNGAILANCEIINYSLELDKEWGVYRAITPQQVEELIKQHKPNSIVITSPTYEGFVANISIISETCKKNKVTLIVDEAHGALYPFSDELPISAVQYADYTIQSLHKTAGGINPTALLHSNDIDPSEALNMITTTSPSYPMLATIESNIKYLNSKQGQKEIQILIKLIKELKKEITNFEFGGDDTTKLLIKSKKYSGEEISDILFEKYKIEDEKTNSKSTMLLCGIGTTKSKLNKLKIALKHIN